jgi:hypothetical protein
MWGGWSDKMESDGINISGKQWRLLAAMERKDSYILRVIVGLMMG